MMKPVTEEPRGASLPVEASALRARLVVVPERPALYVVGIPAPIVPIDAALDSSPDRTSMLWQPPSGCAFVAFGAAATVSGSGPSRMEQIREGGAALFREVEPLDEDAAVVAPSCIGGFAFAPGSASRAPWTTFGDARFVLPRFRYTRTDSGAFFTVTLRGDAPNRQEIFGTADAVYRKILTADAHPARRTPLARAPIAREEMPLHVWSALVRDILTSIREGRMEKVVAARRTRLDFEEPIDVRVVVEELGRAAPNATRFAIRFGGGALVGVTPEQLVRKTGRLIATEALAGSVRSADESLLLENVKERAEHEYVRREILRSLEPLCRDVTYPEVPELRRLRHIAHLRTPFRATLAAPWHVLDLVERLHPTPAVGGVPARDAARWIAEHEPVERGWYAAPIGWFDAQGDGEFCVALRSGVLEGAAAYLYAGGGIVQGSDPTAEYAETDLKLATLSNALHAAG